MWDAIEYIRSIPDVDIISMSLGWAIGIWLCYAPPYDYYNYGLDSSEAAPHYSRWRNIAEATLDNSIIHINAAGNNHWNEREHKIYLNLEHNEIPYNIIAPANCPPPWLHPDQKLKGGVSAVMAVGNTCYNDTLYFKSSRGPAVWENIKDRWFNYPHDIKLEHRDYKWIQGDSVLTGLIKPDVCAPGKYVLSIKPTSRPDTCQSDSCYYGKFSGTSAATPHVAGAAALLLSAVPELTPEHLARALQVTAVDYGEPGKDNLYGAGRIDVYKALKEFVKDTVITKDETWYGIIHVTGDVVVPDTVNITIEPGTVIKVQNGYQLTFEGKLSAKGTNNDPIQFTSLSGAPSNGDWRGIILKADFDTLEYCQISYADTGLTVQNANSVNIRQCSFNQNVTGVYVSGSSVQIISSKSIDNDSGILIKHNSQYQLESNSIEGNNQYGIYIKGSSNGFIDGNSIRSNGFTPNIFSQNLRIGGLFLYNSSPSLGKNIILENQPSGIVAMHGSQPIMNRDTLALNLVERNYINGGDHPNSPDDPINGSELLMFGNSMPSLSIGHNDILDDSSGGYLIFANYTPGDTVDIQYNYWGSDTTNLNTRFYPVGMYDYIPYDTEPNTTLSASPGGGSGGSLSLYREALNLETEENWSGAITKYTSVISDYPASQEAPGSVVRLYVCTGMSGGDYISLQSYYYDLSTNHPNTNLSKISNQYATLCHLPVEQYAEAVADYEAILSDPPTTEDSIYAVIDIGEVHLLSGNSSGLGRMRELGTLHQYRPSSQIDYEKKVNSALSLLFGLTKETDQRFIPSSYRLHQNFPNPFNPVTTIRYDLPEQSYVTIVIYDILGRTVKQLINSTQDTGYKSVVWDGTDSFGKSVGAGVYLYQIKSEGFVETRKMLMLK